MFDPELGLKIHQLLCTHDLENPVDFTKIKTWQNKQHAHDLILKYAEFLAELGIYADVDELEHNARRLVNYLTKERFIGLDYSKFPRVGLMPNQFNYTEPLIARDINLNSTCEHHLVPINGKVLIAYLPQQHLLGLNKFNQIVDFFASRPQLQERLTRQLLLVLQTILLTPNIAIVINAKHECIKSGGVTDTNSWHSTYQFGGVFATDLALKSMLLNYL